MQRFHKYQQTDNRLQTPQNKRNIHHTYHMDKNDTSHQTPCRPDIRSTPRRSVRILTRPTQQPPIKKMIIMNEAEGEYGKSKNLIQITNMRITPTPNTPIAVIVTNNSDNYIRMDKNQEIASLIDNEEKSQY